MKQTINVLVALLVLFSVSVFAANMKTSGMETLPSGAVQEHSKIIITPEGKELELDEQSAKITLDGVQSDWIDDGLVYPEGVKAGSGEFTGSGRGFVHKAYFDDEGNVSLDIYIEENFYAANQAALDDFWDNFNPRFEILKNMTGWSSKRLFGVPLEIYNYGHSAACYGGNASPTHSNVVFSDPMYKNGCHKPYYTEFNSSSSYYNNSGELGDWWPYMNTALHEAQHSISPYPIYTRSWLTEGFSEYLMYNVLTKVVPGNSIPDINQETADTYLYKGFAGYQWDPYVANDYHDTTIYNRELQRSHGYDITGWLFSKLRIEEGLDWDDFYHILNNNKETLDKTFSLGPPYIYYTDALIINVLGKGLGHTDYWNQTDPMFNYYSGGGEFGHGYGCRNMSYSWTTNGPQMPYGDFDWFGELYSDISVSDDNPEPGQEITLTATVYNDGGEVNLKNISVRIYFDGSIIHEEFVDINKNQNQVVNVEYTPGTEGSFLAEVRVDEMDKKIERIEDNNDDSVNVIVEYQNTAPVLEFIGDQEVTETQLLVIDADATDAQNDTLNFSITESLPSAHSFNPVTGVFEWTPELGDAGDYDVTFIVSDGELTDQETITITVNMLNTPPVLDFVGSQEIDEGETLLIDLNANDTQNDSLVYGIQESLPSAYSFDSMTGMFEWTPTFNDAGSYNVTFNVTDGEFTDEEEMTITVNNVVQYTCGDVDNSGAINIGDLTYLVSYLFESGAAPTPLECVGNVDGSGGVNIGDLTHMVNYLFDGGPEPSANCCS